MNMYEALLIAGRSGVGKSTVAWEVSALLQAEGVAHCLIEGDNLAEVHPAPEDDPYRSAITEANLASVWANYAALGHRRLIYTNTVSVLESGMVRRAMAGGPVRVTSVLLTAGDAVTEHRLSRRETGSQLAAHVERSARMSRRLDEEVPQGTVRVPTDGRPVTDVAREVRRVTGW
jgi:predicted kinase